MTTRIHLSEIPPSVNNLYANGPKGRFRTAKYAAWLELSGHELNRQKPAPIVGPYEIAMTFARARAGSDLGNREKAASDLLVKHGVIQDDRLAERITLAWGDGPGVEIEITQAKEGAKS